MADTRSLQEQTLLASQGTPPNASLGNKSTFLSFDLSVLPSRWVIVASLLLALFVARSLGSRRRIPANAHALPRLPGLPFGIGRFWSIPTTSTEAARFFGDLHKTYGPIYEWKVFGVDHIFIGNAKIANDLLAQRAVKYGDRQELLAAGDIRSGSEVLPFLGFGENLIRHRSFTDTILRYSSWEQFFGYPADEAKRTLKRVLDNPERWSEHLVTHCARTAAGCAWGDPDHGTKLLQVVPALLKAVSTSGFTADLLASLAPLPEWLSPWANAEAARKKLMRDAFYEAQQGVIEQVAAGTATESWTRVWLENLKGMEESRLDQHEAAHAVGTAAVMATIATSAPLHTFIAAMCRNPQYMTQLHQEIDRVCGDRLPTLNDIAQLPALRAVVKECVRWQQLTPLGIAHVTTADDNYDGYHIGKGSVVHANHYTISRDPTLYPKGAEFKPERWLESSWPSYQEPSTEYPTLRGDSAFGFGIRTLPEVELVLAELYTLTASLVWAFDIKPSTSAAIPLETNSYVFTMVKPFPCTITPRSQGKRDFVERCCKDSGVLVRDTNSGGDRCGVLREANGEFHW